MMSNLVIKKEEFTQERLNLYKSLYSSIIGKYKNNVFTLARKTENTFYYIVYTNKLDVYEIRDLGDTLDIKSLYSNFLDNDCVKLLSFLYKKEKIIDAKLRFSHEDFSLDLERIFFVKDYFNSNQDLVTKLEFEIILIYLKHFASLKDKQEILKDYDIFLDYFEKYIELNLLIDIDYKKILRKYLNLCFFDETVNELIKTKIMNYFSSFNLVEEKVNRIIREVQKSAYYTYYDKTYALHEVIIEHEDLDADEYLALIKTFSDLHKKNLPYFWLNEYLIREFPIDYRLIKIATNLGDLKDESSEREVFRLILSFFNKADKRYADYLIEDIEVHPFFKFALTIIYPEIFSDSEKKLAINSLMEALPRFREVLTKEKFIQSSLSGLNKIEQYLLAHYFKNKDREAYKKILEKNIKTETNKKNIDIIVDSFLYEYYRNERISYELFVKGNNKVQEYLADKNLDLTFDLLSKYKDGNIKESGFKAF